MSDFPTLDGLAVAGKTVLVRCDLNVPIKAGEASSGHDRIVRAAQTLQLLLHEKARVVVLSHLGRPKGEIVPSLSLAPVADALSDALHGHEVKFGVECVGPYAEAAIAELEQGEIILLENVRFHPGETTNDPDFVDALAKLGDIFVNDAFSCSHRLHASVAGLAERLPSAAGRLMQQELETLHSIFTTPNPPIAAIVGGSKVSSKIDMLEHLAEKMDAMVIGGAMANTFLFAQGHSVGTSLVEPELADTAKNILAHAEKHQCDILLPIDAITAPTLAIGQPCWIEPIEKISRDRMILDIGPQSVLAIANLFAHCNTVVWNGPVGAFETQPFDNASLMLARLLAGMTQQGKLRSIAGGGDTLAALKLAGLGDQFSYVSTAGGAFLEWMEGKTLPGVAALQTQRSAA